MSKINWARIAAEKKSQLKHNHYNLFFTTSLGMHVDQGFTRMADAIEFVKEFCEDDIKAYAVYSSLRVKYGTLGIGGSNEDVTAWFLNSAKTKAKKSQKSTIDTVLNLKFK